MRWWQEEVEARRAELVERVSEVRVHGGGVWGGGDKGGGGEMMLGGVGDMPG
jgi:hypothetical protein